MSVFPKANAALFPAGLLFRFQAVLAVGAVKNEQ
jgi:hypothetical protein